MRSFVLFACLFSCFHATKAQDFTQLFDQVHNSVVVIQTKEQVMVGGGSSKMMMTSSGLGSGVLVSSTEVLTAAHVVQATEGITVEFASGEKIPAEITGLVGMADVALLKLLWSPKDAHVAKMGNSSDVKIGQQVFVIGTPYGLERSLSVGHISGRHADNDIAGGFTEIEFLQTDASINQGNSGGPMFNLKGEVIGISSFILTQSGGFEGIGFAVTSNVASKLLLQEDKPFWHGMNGQLLTGALAQIFNLPQSGGILVEKVVTLSPAGLAGLQAGTYVANIEGEEYILGGDIILAFDGIKINSNENIGKIYDHMSKLKKGDPYSLTVLRGGATTELKAKVP